MPNTHDTLTGLFSDIADSIREKTGQSGTIVADNFSTAIDGITTPVLQSKSATPSLSTQTITPDSPNNGLSSVSVSAVTKELLATLDADFVAGNIKKDVDLFGLLGTLEGGGGGGVEIGTITFAETLAGYTLSHGLGAVPKFVLFFAPYTNNFTSPNTYLIFGAVGYTDIMLRYNSTVNLRRTKGEYGIRTSLTGLNPVNGVFVYQATNTDIKIGDPNGSYPFPTGVKFIYIIGCNEI